MNPAAVRRASTLMLAWRWLAAKPDAWPKAVAAVTLLVGAIPAIYLGTLVARYGVNVPAQDDWEMAPLIAEAHRGSLDWAGLFAQQEEARTFVPKLIFIASTFRGYWDVRDQMMLSVAICAATAACIYILLRRSGLGGVATAVCFWASVWLIFSPTQFELWLLASGFPSFMPALCIAAALVVLGTRWRVGWKFAISAALCAISTFTLAHGLLAWGLTFPVLLASEREPRWKRWLGLWIAASTLCCALYFYGYRKPAHLPEFAPAVSLADYAQFFLAFVGSGFAYASKDHSLAAGTIAGAVVTLLLLGTAVVAIAKWRDREWLRAALPWFALAFYSLGSAALATLGRIGFGVGYAISSRYVTFALYAVVAVVVLLALIMRGAVRWSPSPVVRATVVGVVAILGIGGIAAHRTSAERTRGFFESMAVRVSLARSAVLFSPVLDTAAVIKQYNYPGPATAAARAAELDSLGLVRPPLVRTTQIRALPHADHSDPSASGACEQLSSKETGQTHAAGWAMLNSKGRPADGVVLAYETANGDWTAFALSNEVARRRDVARTFGEDRIWSGWKATFPRGAVPDGARVSAWAVDADGPKLYRLKEFAPEMKL